MIPGEILVLDGDVELTPDRPRIALRLANTGDRPVQIGSHTHLFEINRAIRFDREAAYGFRLDIPAGTALRLEPGDTRDVTCVALAGARRAFGMAGLTNGDLAEQREAAFAAARAGGFLGEP